MLDILRESYARLPMTQRPVLETYLAGYFRISHTEPLIIRALERCKHKRDRTFWAAALDGEAGHAAIYLDDLVGTLGESVIEAIRQYRPCPEIVALLEWADRAFLNGALYRLYLEYLVASHPEAVSALGHVLPKSVAVHLAADSAHWRETFGYVSRRGGISAGAILLIEHALAAEMRHDGLAHAR
jgi:hypothetical protein